MAKTKPVAQEDHPHVLASASVRLLGDSPTDHDLALSKLLRLIGVAWADTNHRPISTAEKLRWSGVCLAALAISRELVKP